jgi:hypothetical protein
MQRPAKTVDNFVLERLAEDEQCARRRYQQDYNPVDLERILETCRVRRQVVDVYRSAKDQPLGTACIRMFLVMAEVWAHHPDYQEGWRPIHAKRPGT